MDPANARSPMTTRLSPSTASLQTFQYTEAGGWSCGQLPDLDSDRTLVMVAAAPGFAADDAAVQQLARRFAWSHLVGCSTAGEIFGDRMHDGTLTVAAMQFAHTRLQRVSAPIWESNSFPTGQAIARQLAGPELRAVLVLAEGLDVNGSELVRGLNSVLPPHVVVVGGLAGDGARFGRTWILEEGEMVQSRVCAVGFHGEALRIGHGSQGGWTAFGDELRVTRAAGNVVFELDGEPALPRYARMLGDRAGELPAAGLLCPLALRAPAAGGEAVVRTLLGVDAKSQSLKFAGDLPTGHLVRFMRADLDHLVAGAGAAARAATLPDVRGPLLSIAVSCVGRRLVLGDRVHEELQAVRRELPAGAQQIGFYSYGELSPSGRGHCDLHNQTMTVTTFAEP